MKGIDKEMVGEIKRNRTETPFALIKNDLVQTLKLNTRLRTFLDGQMDIIQREVEKAKELGPMERLKIMTQVTEMMATLAEGRASTTKLVIEGHEQDNERDVEDIAKRVLARGMPSEEGKI